MEEPADQMAAHRYWEMSSSVDKMQNTTPAALRFMKYQSFLLHAVFYNSIQFIHDNTRKINAGSCRRQDRCVWERINRDPVSCCAIGYSASHAIHFHFPAKIFCSYFLPAASEAGNISDTQQRCIYYIYTSYKMMEQKSTTSDLQWCQPAVAL